MDQNEANIEISKIFKWFADDFGANKTQIIRKITKHAGKENAINILRAPEVDIDYLDYDWNLNE